MPRAGQVGTRMVTDHIGGAYSMRMVAGGLGSPHGAQGNARSARCPTSAILSTVDRSRAMIAGKLHPGLRGPVSIADGGPPQYGEENEDESTRTPSRRACCGSTG